MTTFSNQSTNISTLCTSLSLLCDRLNPPSPALDSKYANEDEKLERENEANDFLYSLSVRATHADDLLVKSTEFLLPAMTSTDETPRMTASELSQVFDSLNSIHAQVIDQMQSNVLVGSPPLGDKVDTNELLTPGEEEQKTVVNTPHHWSIGMPLQMVAEADYETDRNSYASPSSVRSRSFSHTPSRSAPGTPSTPTIRALRLSASTKKIISKDSMVPDSPESYRRLNDTSTSFHSTGENQFLDYEEASIESSRKSLSRAMANMQSNIQASLENTSISSAMADMQKEHSADESSESDDSVDESTLCPTVVAKDRQPQLAVTMEEKAVGRSNSDSDDDDDDDETYEESTICPTVIAQPSETRAPDFVNDENAPERQENTLSPQPPIGYQQIFRNRHDISQVLVQEGETSVLTMDATMFFHDNDAMSHQSSKIYDASSLGEQTPVLDRYRIIPDDSSTGFKIMPNERGSNRKSKSRMDANESIPNSVRFHDRHDEGGSLLGERPEYRKTPFRGGRGVTDDIGDDQQSPNEESSVRFDLPPKNSHAAALAAAKSPRLKFASSPQIGETGSAFRRSPYRRDESSSVGFLSPNVSTRTRLFRKTPLPKNGDTSGQHVDNSSSSSVRFDTELRTPVKHSVVNYRQTPYKSTYDSANLTTVQFDPDAKFEGSTFSAGEKKMYQRTPYKPGMAPSPGSHAKGVQFDDESTPRGVQSSSANEPLVNRAAPKFANTERKTYRSTPYKPSGRVMTPSPEIESTPPGGEEPPINKKASTWQGQSENRAHNTSDRILTRQTSDTNHLPFRSPLTGISPVRKTIASTPQNVRFMNNELLRSPESIASTLTGLTTLREMEKELFPVRASGKPRKSDFSMTQKSSISKISASEYTDADEQMKTLSLETLNQIVDALNGRLFLEKASGNVTERFTSDDAHKILKKSGVEKSAVGTFRKREKVLKALIYWNRLKGNLVENENSPSGAVEYFEIVAGH